MNIFSQYKGLKKEVYVLFVGRVVTAMGAFVWPMLTFLLTIKLGLSDSLATAIIAGTTLISLPMSILGGKLADKIQRKKIIIVFDTCTFILTVTAALLPIGYHTAVLIFLSGLFQTIEGPSYDALSSDYSSTEQRDRTFSLLYLGYNLGFVVGAAVSGILFETNISLAFLLNGFSIITSTVLIALFVKPENAITTENGAKEELGTYEKPLEEKRSVFSVFKERKVVLWMLIISCVSSMSTSVLGIILPLQLKEELGEHGASIYGYLNSLNGLVVILFTPFLTSLLMRITELPKAALGMVLFSAGMVMFSTGNIVWVLFVAMFVYTVGEVVSVLSNPYTSRRIPASHRGRIGGVSSVVFSLFSSFTQFLISFMLEASGNDYRLIWWIFIGVGLLSAVLYVLLIKPDKKTFPLLYEERWRSIGR